MQSSDTGEVIETNNDGPLASNLRKTSGRTSSTELNMADVGDKGYNVQERSSTTKKKRHKIKEGKGYTTPSVKGWLTGKEEEENSQSETSTQNGYTTSEDVQFEMEQDTWNEYCQRNWNEQEVLREQEDWADGESNGYQTDSDIIQANTVKKMDMNGKQNDEIEGNSTSEEQEKLFESSLQIQQQVENIDNLTAIEMKSLIKNMHHNML